MQIEAGKFYRTRDGLRVGPMRDECGFPYRWIESAGDGRVWNDHGAGGNKALGEDLIAEWADQDQHLLAENVMSQAQADHRCMNASELRDGRSEMRFSVLQMIISNMPIYDLDKAIEDARKAAAFIEGK